MPLLTDREHRILELRAQGLSVYKIARVLSLDPPNVTRSHKNAIRKLKEAKKLVLWIQKIGYKIEAEKPKEVKQSGIPV